MSRILWVFPAILFLCAAAHAQDVPRVELSGGYSFLDANLHGPTVHLNGGEVSATENVNGWFGGRLDFKGYAGSDSGINVSAQTITYGPVFSYRRFDRITPYANAQLGAIHASAGYLGISQGAWKFALTAGGGADFNLNERTAIRVQVDYLMSRFLSLRQDNLQFSTGLVFRFGTR